MLSGESAMGMYPVEAVAMLAKIAEATEPHRPKYRFREALHTYGRDTPVSHVDLIALNIRFTLERANPAAVIVPTMSGATARNVTRLGFPCGSQRLARTRGPVSTSSFPTVSIRSTNRIIRKTGMLLSDNG